MTAESLPSLSPEQVLQLLRAHAEMSENLTAVQKRCGELLEDNRRLRGELADAREGILLPGWTCNRPGCGVFNSDMKGRFTHCRACGGPRP